MKRRSSRDERLRRYRSLRDFKKTKEPPGQRSATAGRAFVVQKHAASHLHYDFRLELDGVLLSWAVPKGPSLNASEQRLAMRTEDHPLEYARFEGVIPKNEYGAGAVIVWDRGTWTPLGDAREGLRRGSLTFTLEGEKLRGRWHLVRARIDRHTTKEAWLLFKGRDAAANEDMSIVEQAPQSVLSGRTIEAVARAPIDLWRSNRTPAASSHEAPPRVAAITQLVQRLDTRVQLTNLDKVLYPGQGVTKGVLVAYYAVIAERMLPHLAHRPLTLLRCPDGRTKCFFQRHAKDSVPSLIGRVDVPDARGLITRHMCVDSRDALLALVQLGVLEIHAWGCHADKIERPDQLVLDLDPGPNVGREQLARAALRLRDLLHDLGLESFVKTTGGHGLHVVAPVARRIDWRTFSAFSEAIAVRMVERWPDDYVVNMQQRERGGKIFIDSLRNARGATAIAPYSTRAREGAPVATPISWRELEQGVTPSLFTVATLPARLQQQKARDPWAGYFDLDQTITRAARKDLGV
jgi:bifunctional non-homologous end joining protein LigD